MKNVSKNIIKRLQVNNDVLALNSKDIVKKTYLGQIRFFHPEIIHYLHGPTIRSLIILKTLKFFLANRPKIVSSATKPYFSKISRNFVPFIRPDLILTQSAIWENFFKRYGFKVAFFPNGVDCQAFKPGTKEEKTIIRNEFAFSPNESIVLHVGHIRKNRNLYIFKEIQKIPGVRVVIVGGTTNPADDDLKNDLISAGCTVYHQYFDDISKFYKMADLYVFPVAYDHNKLPESYNEIGAIDTPLSVLEAMACNLPVITTPFGALPRIFSEKEGLYFCSNEEKVVELSKVF